MLSTYLKGGKQTKKKLQSSFVWLDGFFFEKWKQNHNNNNNSKRAKTNKKIPK